jgi:hypothetical protein
MSVAGLLALALALIWMNRYHYEREHIAYHVIRINNFTGQVCYSQIDGTWNSNLNLPEAPKDAASGQEKPYVSPFPIRDASKQHSDDDASFLFGNKSSAKPNLCD